MGNNDELVEGIASNSETCNKLLKTLIKEVPGGKSDVLINSRAIGNYLSPSASIYKDAKDLLDEYMRIILKLAYSQIIGIRGKSIRATHIEKAFTRAALLVSLDENKTTWKITKR